MKPLKTLIATLVAASAVCSAHALAAAPYPDPLITTVMNAENSVKAREAEAYALGVMAYSWGYPLVRLERIIREYIDVPADKPATSYRAPLNQIGWATELSTPADKDMPTANHDTLYMSAVVNLTEPYVLSVPDTADRYYVVNVFSMYHDLEHYIGRRATGTQAGRFAIVPPGWQGTLPAGVKALAATTDKVWLWGRLHVTPGEAMEPVRALQAGFDLRPLSQLDNASYVAPPATLASLPAIEGNDLGFFTHLGYAMRHNQLKPGDEALVGQFERIGLTWEHGFDQAKLAPEQVKGLKRALEDAPLVAGKETAAASVLRNGWYMTLVTEFGFNYPGRALMSGPYLGGNLAEEATYPIRYTDAEGKPLDGTNRYEVAFTKAPPVGAFWSLTIYNADDKMLVANPIGRYKVGSDTAGLRIREDGSFSIPIQRDEPQGADKANWLPAPKGNFYLLLRLYQPNEAILDGTYPLPQVKKM
ncbi:DUF1254 domain-containing protein [Zestomonas carbonaria]|uniref:DUF1254 domain-containing protein n=1 Tax=Zestomonas carbonaria TaxID=2762745 RepID=A0A7U7EPL5_9GAMM|nr:DUF1254 domain-containing protein [Pseudomonas carbonaria]CAD5108418.1 hypothetical protein PSEWESI4_02703 [Pseudomonas carbonaria]